MKGLIKMYTHTYTTHNGKSLAVLNLNVHLTWNSKFFRTHYMPNDQKRIKFINRFVSLCILLVTHYPHFNICFRFYLVKT